MISLLDIPLFFAIACVECFLSLDNMVILSHSYQAIPLKERPKFFWIGIASALVIRLLMILSAAWILQFKLLWIAGALYLIYLSIEPFFQKNSTNPAIPAKGWVFLKIEWIDFLFSLDALLVSFSMVSMVYDKTDLSGHLWLIYAGAIVGLFVVRRAALHLAKRILSPRIKKAVAILLGLIGWDLLLKGLEWELPWISYILEFGSFSLLILILSWIYIDFKDNHSLE